MTEKLLEVKDLKIHFNTLKGVVHSVNDISFDLDKGETLAIVGESGCGKSVTSLSLIGLIPPPGEIVKGTINFKGKDLAKLNEIEMRKIRGNEISMVFQNPSTSINPLIKIGNQLTESLRLHQNMDKKQAKEKAIDLLVKVGISHAKEIFLSYPHTLSGGMKQRVMIAMALSCNPELLIADEPTTALDVTIQAQILELLKQVKEDTGTSIILISHDLGVVAEMVDKVIVLYSGEVVEQADVVSLFHNPKHPYTKGLLNSSPTIDEERDELASIEGTVPNPYEVIEGCRFYSRCPYARDKCKTAKPQLDQIGDNHEVRCWLYE